MIVFILWRYSKYYQQNILRGFCLGFLIYHHSLAHSTLTLKYSTEIFILSRSKMIFLLSNPVVASLFLSYSTFTGVQYSWPSLPIWHLLHHIFLIFFLLHCPLILYFLIYFIEVWLIYNVWLISIVKHSDSVLHMYLFLFIFLSVMVCYMILNIVPCVIQ